MFHSLAACHMKNMCATQFKCEINHPDGWLPMDHAFFGIFLEHIHRMDRNRTFLLFSFNFAFFFHQSKQLGSFFLVHSRRKHEYINLNYLFICICICVCVCKISFCVCVCVTFAIWEKRKSRTVFRYCDYGFRISFKCYINTIVIFPS